MYHIVIHKNRNFHYLEGKKTKYSWRKIIQWVYEWVCRNIKRKNKYFFSRYTRALNSITKQKGNQLATINWIKQDLNPIERKQWFMQNTMDQLSLILKCFFIIDIHIQYIFIITNTHFCFLMYPDISP